MAYSVKLSPQARRDVQETADFLRDNVGIERARKWKNGIIAAIESLSEMPSRCAVAEESAELGVELRHLMHRPHRIIFQVQEAAQTVDVLRVYHSARAPLQIEDLP